MNVEFHAILIFCLILFKMSENMAWNPERNRPDPIVAYLNKNNPQTPRDLQIGSADVSSYYLRAKGLSKLLHPVPYNFNLTDDSQRNQLVLNELKTLKTNPPKYIIYSGTWAEILIENKLPEFIANHYTERAITQLHDDFYAHLLELNTTKKPTE